MTPKGLLVGALCAVVISGMVSCTHGVGGPGRAEKSPALSPPIPGRVAGACEYLSHDSMLRKFVAKDGEEGFPTDERIADDVSTCGFNERVKVPVRGGTYRV